MKERAPILLGHRWATAIQSRCARWLTALLAFLCCAQAVGAPAYVQSNFSDSQSSASSVSVSYASAQTAGDLNVVAIGWSDSTSHVVSVTDSSGNTYAVAASPVVFSDSRSQVIYYAKNIAAATAGANTVTVTFDAAAPWVDARIVEYSGLDTNNPLDGSASALGMGATMSSGAVTTTSGNDLLVAANDVAGYVTASDSNYAQRLFTDDGGIVEDQVVNSQGTYSASATQQIQDVWVMQIVAFRATSGGDTQPPSAPSALNATANAVGQVSLTWTGSTDNVGVTAYRVERCQGTGCSSFAQIGVTTATSYSDTGLIASTPYSYRLDATDAAGNLSGYSGTASVTTLAGVSYVQGNASDPQSPASSVSVSYASAQTAGDLNVVAIGWSDSTSHVQSVADSNGNTYSVAVAPTVYSGSRSQVIYYAKNIAAAGPYGNTVTVTFDAAASWADVRIAEYNGVDTAGPLDGGAGASGVGSSMSSGAITTSIAGDLLVGANDVAGYTTAPGTGYTQRLFTTDGGVIEDQVVGAAGSYSASATQQISDVWAMQGAAFKPAGGGGGGGGGPTVPTGLTTTVASSSEIDLSWTASTDPAGVTGYLLERCQGASCTTFAQIATPSSTSYSDTGLTASTSYTYRVRATDAASNLSGYSGTSTAVTSSGGGGGGGDTQPPSAPTGLSASAISGSQISLTWTASTDNFGVTGYLIERCQGGGCTTFAQVGTSTAVGFSDTSLTSSTAYSYRVRATDAAGNLSDYSNISSATTGPGSGSGGSVTSTYTYDAQGRLQSVTTTNGSTTTTQYTYDAAGHVVGIQTH